MPKFEVGDVVEWNPNVIGDSSQEPLITRVVKYGYSRGPFLIRQTDRLCAVVTSLDGSNLLEDGVARRTEYHILYSNLQKNIFLTAARKAIQNAQA